MKLTYDPAVDAAYVMLVARVDEREVVHTQVCDVELENASIHLDFDEHRHLLGIEILGASRVLAHEVLASAQRES